MADVFVSYARGDKARVAPLVAAIEAKGWSVWWDPEIDPGQEFELSRWRLLAVRSRSASFRYRGVAVDMKQVARELNVRFIVEGSVRRLGERIRISAQLIDTETGSHIWAEKFDRELAGIFSVQDQVVQTIVSTLVGRVQVSDVERARRKPPASLAAYEYVLKGNATRRVTRTTSAYEQSSEQKR